MIGSFAFGQETELTKEEALFKTAKMMIGIKNSTQEAFSTTSDYNSFRARLIGKQGVSATTEGENLLVKVYELHSTKQTDDQIYKTYDGKEIGYALRKYQELGFNDGKLFNDDTNALSRAAAGGGCGCSWYQIGCWFDCIFGPKAGPKLLEGLISILIAVLTP